MPHFLVHCSMSIKKKRKEKKQSKKENSTFSKVAAGIARFSLPFTMKGKK